MQINCRKRLQKSVFDPRVFEKPTVKPMMKFSQLIADRTIFEIGKNFTRRH